MRRGTRIAHTGGMKRRPFVFICSLILPFFLLFMKPNDGTKREIAYIPKRPDLTHPYKNILKSKFDRKNKEVRIAVIDTGVDVNHVALKKRIWVNKFEDLNKDGKCTSADNDGKDQDANGYIDDCMGWNFVHSNNKPIDNHGHGTHITGIIAAIISVFPNYNIKIIPLKYYDPSVTKNHIKNTINAIDYAIKMKVDLINYSAGGNTPSLHEKRAIIKAQKKGILFVAAAGNERNDVTKTPYYPSSYNLSNILSVTAVNGKGDLLVKSNWGRGIDIAAPGFNVLSTLPHNKYGNMSGTSMAASFITGLLSIIMVKEDCTALEAAEFIKVSASKSNKLFLKVTKNRMVNPTRALKISRSNSMANTNQQKKIKKIFTTASIL